MNDNYTSKKVGHVKLELYNEEGVFFEKEKHNLILQDANKLIANMMADPSKRTRAKKHESTDAISTVNENGKYEYMLEVRNEEIKTVEVDVQTGNTQTVFNLSDVKEIKEVKEVKKGDTDLELNSDVFVEDHVEGVLRFATAPDEAFTIKVLVKGEGMKEVVEGSLSVTVEGQPFTKGKEANDELSVFEADEKRGILLFQSPVQDVKIDYEYTMPYGLGFMGVGGLPEGHVAGQPFEYTESSKLLPNMKDEFEGARVPIQFPAPVTEGAREIELIHAQPVSAVTVKQTLEVTEEGTRQFDLNHLYDDGFGLTGRSLFELVSLKKEEDVLDLSNVTIDENSSNGVKVTLDENLEAGSYEIEFKLQLNNSFLNYQLSQSPLVELISVRHISAVDSSDIQAYEIVHRGLKPEQGDVWITNSKAGQVRFRSEPVQGPAPNKPGQIQFEYRINSGTVVQYIADFPQGTPAPSRDEAQEVFVANSGQTSFMLRHEVAKQSNGQFEEVQVRIGPNALTSSEFEISTDGRTITITTATVTEDDQVEITYPFMRTTHDIYQVAMFDSQEEGTIFNIAGIGPITKDSRTGMRISWTVTY